MRPQTKACGAQYLGQHIDHRRRGGEEERDRVRVLAGHGQLVQLALAHRAPVVREIILNRRLHHLDAVEFQRELDDLADLTREGLCSDIRWNVTVCKP